MRRTLGLVFLGWLFSGILLAQSLGDSIKYEIIRETVHFLALDENISTDTGLIIDCPSNDYGCMETQLASNSIQGLQSRIKSWKTKPAQTPEDLIQLKDEIHTEIIERDGKNYRKEFAAYTDYINRLEFLMDSYYDKNYPGAMMVQADGQDTGSGDTGPPVAENRSISADGNSPLFSGNILLYLTLGLSVLAVLISILAYFKKQGEKDMDILQKQVKQLSLEFQSLPTKENEKKFLDGLDLHRRKLESLEKKLVEITAASIPSPGPKKALVEKKQKQAFTKIENLPEPFPEIRYAKFLDLDNGFSDARFRDFQNGELAYEITINGDTATYAVSEDPRAQKYAIFSFEYLKKGCEFENQPHEGEKIVTLKKGSLIKSGHSWIIQTKAVIRFS